MTNLFEFLDISKADTVQHYGVKGMKWGEITEKDNTTVAANVLAATKKAVEIKSAPMSIISTKRAEELLAEMQAAGDATVSETTKNTNAETKVETDIAKMAAADLVKAVIRGDYGNGEARKKALGSRYREIQDLVNAELKVSSKKSTAKKSTAKKRTAKKRTAKKRTAKKSTSSASTAAAKTPTAAKASTSSTARVRKKAGIKLLAPQVHAKKNPKLNKIAMSDLGGDVLIHDALVEEDYLAHHGVLGMKWGVRKSRSGKMRARATLSRAFRKDQAWAENAQTKVYDKVYRKAASKIRRETRALNKRNAGKNFKVDSADRRAYYKEYSAMVEKQLNAAATLFGQSPNKRYQLNFSFDLNKNLVPKAEITTINKSFAQRERSRNEAKAIRKRQASEIKHSSEEESFSVEWQMRIDDGFITDVIDYISSRKLSEIDPNLDADELMHYGVLGMKWGVLRDQMTLDALAGRKQYLDSDPEVKRLRSIELATGVAQIGAGTIGVGLGAASILSTGSPAATGAAILGASAIKSGAVKVYGKVRSDTKWLTDTIEKGDESKAYIKTTKLAQKYINRDVKNITAYFKYDTDFKFNVETRMKYLEAVRAIQESHFNNAAVLNGVSPSGIYKIHKMMPDAIGKEAQIKGIVALDPGEKWSDSFNLQTNMMDPNLSRNLWNSYREAYGQPEYSGVEFDKIEAFAKEVSIAQKKLTKRTANQSSNGTIKHSDKTMVEVGTVTITLDEYGFVKHLLYTDSIMEDNKNPILQHALSDIDEDELMHYGILGMKWGVRRDQRTLDHLAGRQVNYRDKNGNEAVGTIDGSSSTNRIMIRDSQGYIRKADRASTKRILDSEKEREKADKKSVTIGNNTKRAETLAKRELRKAKRQEKKDEKAAKRLEDIASGKIKPKKMTPTELKARADRLQLEKLIRVLEKDIKGENYLASLSKDVAKRGITEAGTKIISSLLLQSTGKALDPRLFGKVQSPAAIKIFKDLTGISVNPLTIDGANTGNQYEKDDALKNQILYELLMNAGKQKEGGK